MRAGARKPWPSMCDAHREADRNKEGEHVGVAIEAKRLTKRYGRRGRGVADVDLEVREGEVFGFLGPNGAGKTTNIRTLLGFLRPTSGDARIFGLDIRERAWRSGRGWATCRASLRWRTG